MVTLFIQLHTSVHFPNALYLTIKKLKEKIFKFLNFGNVKPFKVSKTTENLSASCLYKRINLPRPVS